MKWSPRSILEYFVSCVLFFALIELDTVDSEIGDDVVNCFYVMVDRQKAFSFISSRDHCQRSWPSRISDLAKQKQNHELWLPSLDTHVKEANHLFHSESFMAGSATVLKDSIIKQINNRFYIAFYKSALLAIQMNLKV